MARKKAKALPPKTITVYAEILQETEKAILVRCEDEADGVWLPKSQIKYAGERGDTSVEIEIPELLADEKGFFDGMGMPAAPTEPKEPEQPETVTIQGSVGADFENNPLVFAVGYEDEDGNYDETEYRIEQSEILSLALNDNEPDTITLSRAYALELGLVPPVEPADENPSTKRAFGDNVKWLKEEHITVTQPLSDSEKARYAEEMAALDKEIEDLEDERSEVSSRLKKQIDAKEDERRGMSAHVNDGELRTISCDCLKDYNTGEMIWTDAYPPYAEVLRRKMTKEEMQPSLLEYAEKMENAHSADAMDFDALADVDGGEADAPEEEGASTDEPETAPQEAA